MRVLRATLCALLLATLLASCGTATSSLSTAPPTDASGTPDPSTAPPETADVLDTPVPSTTPPETADVLDTPVPSTTPPEVTDVSDTPVPSAAPPETADVPDAPVPSAAPPETADVPDAPVPSTAPPTDVPGTLVPMIAPPEMMDALATRILSTGLAYVADAQGDYVTLQKINKENYLFLPSTADLKDLTLYFKDGTATLTVGDRELAVTSGQPFDLAALYPKAPDDGVYTFTLRGNSEKTSVKLMVSKSIGAMYITSDDPAKKGRSYVEKSKKNKATGWMTLQGADGMVVYSGELTQIKGRGNSTWDLPKKPYQIKLGKKTDLLETGDSNEAAKTWVLLANFWDGAFLRNSLTCNLAAALGLPYTPSSRPVDLYYDGEYRGTYLLSEKPEIHEARVDINDLEEDFEDANPQVEDFDKLRTAKGTNAYGNTYQYVTGLNDPADLSGGYLLEIDYALRIGQEKSYFRTTQKEYVVCKSPEYLSKNAIEYISEFYQEFEDAVFNGGVNPTTGKSYTEYVDLDSLVRCYLVLEFSQVPDAFRSSTFFYKPAGEEKLYAGPVWDFDTAYGFDYRYPRVTNLSAGTSRLGKALRKIPSFSQALEEVYLNGLKPLVADVILSTDPEVRAGPLRSVASYSAEVFASQRMNYVLWADSGVKEHTAAVKELRNFINKRDQFMAGLTWTSR